jgi:hypothetical protein
MAALPAGGQPNPANCILYSAAYRQIGHGDEGTFSKFATTPGSSDICPLFTERMAEIIRYAGANFVMVLSSSWRKSTHRNRVAALEAQLSRYAGRNIVFEQRTRPGGDTPEKRLELIGDFVQEYTSKRRNRDSPIRVVVLEDFAATHPRQWSIKDPIRSPEDIEAYWRERSCQPALTAVKLVHTYDEWVTDGGLQVQIGTGLTMQKVSEAKQFLLGIPPESSGGEQRTSDDGSIYTI